MTRQGIDLDELAALEEQRRFLLTSLDDLEREHDAGDLDDDDYFTLRSDYTVRAARVIEAIDERKELIDATDPGHRGIRRFLLVVAVAAVATVAGLVVASTSGGRTSSSDASGALVPSKETKACMDQMGTTFGVAAKSNNGNDFAAQAVATLKCFTARIEADPTDAVAYTYRGRTESLLASQLKGIAQPSDVAGFSARADADFRRAMKLAPTYPDVIAFAAMDALANGRRSDARAYLARLDRLQLPAASPVLAIVNNVLRPALQGSSTSTTDASTVGPAGVPTTSTSIPTTTSVPGR
ncbi:MAG: hypothetical protein JST73_06915 [Actinobacteria bacterium]|nr:hypothetical protein [Actinomycetota bacterium]